MLQEASARVAIVTGRSLASAIRNRYRGHPLGLLFVLVIVVAVIVGCAAYQAGNVLGSVAGATLRLDLSPRWVTLAVSVTAGLLLFYGSARFIARLLGTVVAVMGVSFLVTAILLAPAPGAVLTGVLLPRIPAGSGVLALGLIGTTVVPYNLFLGSGIASGQRLADARFGICVAVGLGGIVSMGILIVGATLQGSFSFAALAAGLSRELGGWAVWMLALGLFAAGLSSAITAPLAAAITAQGLFSDDDDALWQHRSWRYRLVWLAVLVCGLVFGLAGASPIPVIILAQAFNGVLLPVVAAFLYRVVNDRQLLGAEHANGAGQNGVMLAVFAITVLLGTSSILRALDRAVGAGESSPEVTLILAAIVAATGSILLWRKTHST